MPMKLKHFSVTELCRSEKAAELGIPNIPGPELALPFQITLAGLERVRAFLGHPMKIDSGYRSERLNRAVGGSPHSQHLRGLAVDFRCPAFGSPREVALALSKAIHILGIDQLILEPTWVHMSFSLDPRAEVLTRAEGKYLPGIVHLPAGKTS
jgi:zinc D-Ala-D-Ala carboxypeptidase